MSENQLKGNSFVTPEALARYTCKECSGYWGYHFPFCISKGHAKGRYGRNG